MDKMSTAPRDRDPIEAVILFLFKNWILLVTVPVLAGVIALATTQGAPQSYAASIRLPPPPAPLAAFDDVWQSLKAPTAAQLSSDGSVLLTNAASTEQQASAPLLEAQKAVIEIALGLTGFAQERQDKFVDMERRMLDEEPASAPEVLSLQAYALAILVPATETARQYSRDIRQWSKRVEDLQVTAVPASNSNRAVPFAVFGGFTLAVLIAISRWLFDRMRNKPAAG